MPLTSEQSKGLTDAIGCYAFPRAYFDFQAGREVFDLSMAQLETRIRDKLISRTPELVEIGLASILYWGYSQMGGLAQVRVDRFREGVKPTALKDAANLFAENPRPSLLAISDLKLPEFSGVSFLSKVRMFLDPCKSATLDKQIMRIHEICPDTVLAKISYKSGETSIRVTRSNSEAYEFWCVRLEEIRDQYFPNLRTVDIERGLFHLVQTRQVGQAAQILEAA
ncbi:hypothetical protein NR756_03565 [Alloalcanivorax xenomutans]|uniref:hypothetical protein n=1 Tax=Alloalcanivorax xenomutans TaxID=1094342 RepID=UPI003A810DFE